MRVRDLGPPIAAVAVALTLTGCASTLAPKHWLPTAARSTHEAYGGWIAGRVGSGNPTRDVRGELIAVQDDSVFVLTHSGLEAIPTSLVRTAQVSSYDIQWNSLGSWWLLGTVSTASHGVGLILTAPIWMLVGTISTVAASHAPILRHPDRGWGALSAFARFPQGLPPGLDRSALRLRRAPGEGEPVRTGQGISR